MALNYDTQLYIHSQCNAHFPTNSISACIDDINDWMTSLFPQTLIKQIYFLLVHLKLYPVSVLTIWFNLPPLSKTSDSSLSFLLHIFLLTESGFFHLHNISECIGSYLLKNWVSHRKENCSSQPVK